MENFQWRTQGGDGATALFGLTVNVWIIFALFLKASFRDWTVKCVSQSFYSDCPCFLPVKNCGKMHPNLSFWGQKAQPPHRTHSPRRLTAVLTEVLNTPLWTFMKSYSRNNCDFILHAITLLGLGPRLFTQCKMNEKEQIKRNIARE